MHRNKVPDRHQNEVTPCKNSGKRTISNTRTIRNKWGSILLIMPKNQNTQAVNPNYRAWTGERANINVGEKPDDDNGNFLSQILWERSKIQNPNQPIMVRKTDVSVDLNRRKSPYIGYVKNMLQILWGGNHRNNPRHLYFFGHFKIQDSRKSSRIYSITATSIIKSTFIPQSIEGICHDLILTSLPFE